MGDCLIEPRHRQWLEIAFGTGYANALKPGALEALDLDRLCTEIAVI
jgi:hypothetical protein